MASETPGRGLTVSGLWIDGVALLRPHLGNVIWIAAMFMFLPQLSVDILMPKPAAPGVPDPGPLAAIALVSIIALIGQLASIAILLGGATAPQTVGDAIQRGLQLLPRALLALVLVMLCLIPVILLFGAAAAALGFSPEQLAKPTAALSIVLLLFAGLVLICAARLITLNTTVVGDGLAAWDSVQRAWRMSKDAGWALAGFMLTLMLALYSTAGLLTMVGGVVVSLLFGQAIIGKLILATLTAAAATAFSLVSLSAGVVAYRALAK